MFHLPAWLKFIEDLKLVKITVKVCITVSIPLLSFVDVPMSIMMMSLFLLVSHLVFQLYMIFYTIEP